MCHSNLSKLQYKFLRILSKYDARILKRLTFFAGGAAQGVTVDFEYH